ncbi:MAG: hypothetical protein JWR37_2048 [Mycobacterium sp.]|nr:hypothetical protein [Mycobacterium sp.]
MNNDLANSAADAVIPLRTDFDLVFRGYDQNQVQHYVERVESDYQILAADRDAAADRAEALAQQVEALRTENVALRARIDRICRTPLDTAGLTERAQRMLSLVREEADEIVAAARAVAERARANAEDEVARLREQAERELGALIDRRRRLDEEHHYRLAQHRAQLDGLARAAEQRRAALDQQAAELRAARDAQCASELAARRADADRDIHTRTMTARHEAHRIVVDAEATARQRLADAEWQVRVLRSVRDRLTEQLRTVGEALDAAVTILTPDTEGSDQNPTRPQPMPATTPEPPSDIHPRCVPHIQRTHDNRVRGHAAA